MNKLSRIERIQKYAFDMGMPVLTESEITRLRAYLRSPFKSFVYHNQELFMCFGAFFVMTMMLSIALDCGAIFEFIFEIVKLFMGLSTHLLSPIIVLLISMTIGGIEYVILRTLLNSADGYHSTEYLKRTERCEYTGPLQAFSNQRIPTENDLSKLLKQHPEYNSYAEKILGKRPLMQGEFDFLQSLAETKKLD